MVKAWQVVWTSCRTGWTEASLLACKSAFVPHGLDATGAVLS